MLKKSIKKINLLTLMSLFILSVFSLSMGQDTTTTSVKDDLFQSSEEVKTIEQLESYIKTNKKIPDLLSEKEIEEKGISRDQMLKRLVKAVKKLNIYVIELKKENAKLRKKINKIEDYLRDNQ